MWRRFFLTSTLPYLYFLRIQTIQFLFGEFLTHSSNKYNGNCFFDLYREYCSRSSHWPGKLGRYLDLEHYLLVQKNSCYCIKNDPFHYGIKDRNSFSWNSLKNEVLKNFANFIAKHLRRCLFLIHLQAVGMKLNKTPKQVFSVNFAKSVKIHLL